MLLLDNFAHLLDRHGGLDVYPLVQDGVPVPELEYKIDATNVHESDKSKSSRLLAALVLQDHTVLDFSKVLKVLAELGHAQVVWQATHEYLAQLGIDLFTDFEAVERHLRECHEFFVVFFLARLRLLFAFWLIFAIPVHELPRLLL